MLEEAREIQNPELDLADKGVATFEELPGLCELCVNQLLLNLVGCWTGCSGGRGAMGKHKTSQRRGWVYTAKRQQIGKCRYFVFIKKIN